MFFRKKAKAAAPPPQPAPIPAPPPPPVYVPAGDPDLQGIGRLLWLWKTLIIGITLCCAGAAFVNVNEITPRYRSESRLLLESRENVFLRADADKQVDRSTIDEQAVTSQTQVVSSLDLAREEIKKEGLADIAEFDPSAG